MAMSVIWCVLTAVSVVVSLFCGTSAAVSAAALEGASAGISLAVSIAGPLLLWSGFACVLEHAGLTQALSKRMHPVFRRLFPDASRDEKTLGSICSNVTANLLGLGNAATPFGIEAVRCLRERSGSRRATDEMCRFVVMNSASLQLIPATVAAVRTAAGCRTPFDILPAVWFTSVCSMCAGLCACFVLQRVIR